MNGIAEIIVVAVAVGAAVCYLAWKGYVRLRNKSAGCGGCGGECGGEVSDFDARKTGQVFQSIELLTVVTAEDRRQ